MLRQGLNGNGDGFTLVELIITISIIAVIASIAYPNIIALLRHQESMTVRNDLQNFLSTGKQFTLIYQTPIHLCIADENKQCVTSNGKTLLTFIDKDNNNRYSPTDKLLEINDLSLRYGQLIMNIARNQPFIIFKAESGRPTGYMGHIKYCPTDGNTQEMFKVTFSKTAIIKVKTHHEEDTGC